MDTEAHQGARPIERLGDRGRLLHAGLANRTDEARRLLRQARIELGNLELDYPAFLIDRGKIDEQMKTTTAERLRELAGAIRGQHHRGMLARPDGAELRDADLEIGEQLEQEGLELLVGLVHLVDQQ